MAGTNERLTFHMTAVDNLSKVLEKVAKKLGHAEKAMERLDKSLDRMGDVQEINKSAEAIRTLGSSIKQLGLTNTQLKETENALLAISAAGDTLRNITGLEQLGKPVKALGTGLESIARGLSMLSDKSLNLDDAFDNLSLAMTQMEVTLAKAGSGFRESIIPFSAFATAVKDVANGLKILGTSGHSGAIVFSKAMAEIIKNIPRMKKLETVAPIMQKFGVGMNQLKSGLQGLQNFQVGDIEGFERFMQVIEPFIERMERLGLAGKGLKDLSNGLNSVVSSLKKLPTADDGFENLLVKIRELSDDIVMIERLGVAFSGLAAGLKEIAKQKKPVQTIRNMEQALRSKKRTTQQATTRLRELFRASNQTQGAFRGVRGATIFWNNALSLLQRTIGQARMHVQQLGMEMRSLASQTIGVQLTLIRSNLSNMYREGLELTPLRRELAIEMATEQWYEIAEHTRMLGRELATSHRVLRAGAEGLMLYTNNVDFATTALEYMHDVLLRTSNNLTVTGDDMNELASSLGRAMEHAGDRVQTLRALEKMGIVFSQGQVQALGYADALERQQIVLDALRSSYGGFSRAIAQTPFGELNRLRATFEDIRVAIGNAFIPFIATLARALHRVIPPMDEINRIARNVFGWIIRNMPTIIRGVGMLVAVFVATKAPLIFMGVVVLRVLKHLAQVGDVANMSFSDVVDAVSTGIDIFMNFADIVADAVIVIIDIISWIVRLVDDFVGLETAVRTAVGVFIALKALKVAVWAYKVAKAIVGIGIAIKTATGPIGWLIGALGLVFTGIRMIYNAAEDLTLHPYIFKKDMKSIGLITKTTYGYVVDTVSWAYKELTETNQLTLTKLADGWKKYTLATGQYMKVYEGVIKSIHDTVRGHIYEFTDAKGTFSKRQADYYMDVANAAVTSAGIQIQAMKAVATAGQKSLFGGYFGDYALKGPAAPTWYQELQRDWQRFEVMDIDRWGTNFADLFDRLNITPNGNLGVEEQGGELERALGLMVDIATRRYAREFARPNWVINNSASIGTVRETADVNQLIHQIYTNAAEGLAQNAEYASDKYYKVALS